VERKSKTRLMPSRRPWIRNWPVDIPRRIKIFGMTLSKLLKTPSQTLLKELKWIKNSKNST